MSFVYRHLQTVFHEICRASFKKKWTTGFSIDSECVFVKVHFLVPETLTRLKTTQKIGGKSADSNLRINSASAGAWIALTFTTNLRIREVRNQSKICLSDWIFNVTTLEQRSDRTTKSCSFAETLRRPSSLKPSITMSNIAAVPTSLQLVRRLGIDLIQSRYQAIKPIGAAYGGVTFTGNDNVTQDKVFIKYLIGPRGLLDKAKFSMERDALKAIRSFDPRVAPRLLADEDFPNIESSVIVTEWVEGELLSAWLARCSQYTIDQRLSVFHRITSALSIATRTYLHRDFHPGNVMLLPDDSVRMGPEFFDRVDEINQGVKVLDWGEAIPIISGNYDEEPDHHFTMLALGPRAIGGAFSSLPPEIFKPGERNQHIGGTYEVWGMAALLYRMLTAKELDTPKSIGEYVQQIYDGNLKKIISSRASELANLNLPGGGIIPSLFAWMCNESPAERPPLYTVREVMFDIRYEELNLFEPDLEHYMKHLKDESKFTPVNGWKFRREFERD